MTERKPSNMKWESWIDKQIRDAEARGEFENLPGKGKPIPDLQKPHDELWWVRQLLAREKLSVTPATLGLRKELEDAVERIGRATREGEVKRLVERINRKIADVNSKATSGPPSDIAPLDLDDVLARWRENR